MSYDLYFRSDRAVSVEELRAYFAKQRTFGLNDERAYYQNEATDVYFGFDFTTEVDEGCVPVAFNMNYFRPHVFGLEAEPVVTAFVRAFRLGIEDPQTEGMGDGPYSPEGFLRGWNAGNRLGYRAILTMDGAPTPFTLPSARVRGIWHWNGGKDLNNEAMTDLLDDAPACFLPTVLLLQTGEHEVKTAVIWDTKMAIAIPDVDLVLTRGEEGLLAVPTNDLWGLLPVHSRWNPEFTIAEGMPVGLATRLVGEVPADVTARVRAAMQPFQPLSRLGADRVLDAELVADARAHA